MTEEPWSMDIAIVTDSTADIPADIARLHQIHVVPNVVVIDGQSLEDGICQFHLLSSM